MPRSVPLRMSRPNPCRSERAAAGTCSSEKPSRPCSASASSRACTTGSPGGAKGSLSMTTSESASPGTSTPSQKLWVAKSTDGSARNRSSSRCLGSSPWSRSW